MAQSECCNELRFIIERFLEQNPEFEPSPSNKTTPEIPLKGEDRNGHTEACGDPNMDGACFCIAPLETKQAWEEELENVVRKKMESTGAPNEQCYNWKYWKVEVEQFISSLLTQTRKEMIEEVVRIAEETRTKITHDEPCPVNTRASYTCTCSAQIEIGANYVIDDLISEIKKP